MLTKKGKRTYPLPDDFGGVQVAIVGDRERMEPLYQLCGVEFEEMIRLYEKEQKAGKPEMFCLADDKLWLWPEPDAAYQVSVRYHPQIKAF